MSNAGIITERGDVKAVGTMTDNAIIRGDGEKRIQDSGITVDDSDNISNVNTLSVIDAATTRTNLGLGSISTQNSSSVTISGGTITGITDLAVADGGTGSSTAAEARTNLGLGDLAVENAPLVVSKGGIGRQFLTTYAPLCGGTTTTGAVQSIASVGTAAQVLTSNGAGALPTFQNAAGSGYSPTYQLQIANMWNFVNIGQTSTNQNAIDNRLILTPFMFSKAMTLASLALDITANVAGSSMRFGIYTINRTTGVFSLLADYGSVSTATTGIKSVVATPTLTAGTVYFVAIDIDENGGSISNSAWTDPIPFMYTGSTLYTHFYKDNVDALSALPNSFNFTDFIKGTGATPLTLYQ